MTPTTVYLSREQDDLDGEERDDLEIKVRVLVYPTEPATWDHPAYCDPPDIESATGPDGEPVELTAEEEDLAKEKASERADEERRDRADAAAEERMERRREIALAAK